MQREGQKTKWIVDLVMKVDEEYKQDLGQQQQQIVSGLHSTCTHIAHCAVPCFAFLRLYHMYLVNLRVSTHAMCY